MNLLDLFNSPTAYEALRAEAQRAAQSPAPADLTALMTGGAPASARRPPTPKPASAAFDRGLVSGAQTLGGAVAGIPQRALEASNERLTGGDYNPAPVVDLATLMVGGGMPGATRSAGAAALNPVRYAEDAGRAIAAHPTTAAAAAAGTVAAAPSATAGDPGDEFGILKPQLPSEPQPRPALMPDESQMPEKYRMNPGLRRRWYEAEVQKLAPVNAQRQAEDAAMRDEWRTSITTAQEKYAADIEAARRTKAEREAGMTFLERNPGYRYVPLAGSLAAGGLANLFARGARAKQKAWNAGLQGATGETRAALAAGDVPRAQQLSGHLDEYLKTAEPNGKLPWYGYAAAAGAGPELAAVPSIVDFNTPGRPREEARAEMQDPAYWLKTYMAPALLGASAAKSGALLTRPVPSAVPAARGAIAEADVAATQAAAREQSALSASEAETARLQGILDAQAAKRAAAAEKAKATRAAKAKAGRAKPRSANLVSEDPEM